MRAWQAGVVAATAPSAEEWFFFAGLGLRGDCRLLPPSTRVDVVVVQALRYQDKVGDAEVDCEGGDGGDEAGPEGAGEVGDVADEPDEEEGEGYALCGALLVVFDELGYLE